MTSEEIFDILRPIIISVTGVPECILEVIGTDSPAPSPTGEYAVVRPQQSISERGQANINRSAGFAASTQSIDVRAQIICTAWVNFYRGDATNRASKLKQCNKRSDVSEALFRAGLGWMGTAPVNNLTGLQFETVESRAQIAITLAYETSDTIIINSIDNVPVIVEYENGDVITTVNIT